MKTISINISSKPIQSFIAFVGLCFWVVAWYITQVTENTTRYLFSLYDLQVESLTMEGIDSTKMVLDGETLREIAISYNSYSDYGVIGLAIAGGFFLLISLALSVFSITVNNKAKDDLSEKVLGK
jgi:hypothetical protein